MTSLSLFSSLHVQFPISIFCDEGIVRFASAMLRYRIYPMRSNPPDPTPRKLSLLLLLLTPIIPYNKPFSLCYSWELLRGPQRTTNRFPSFFTRVNCCFSQQEMSEGKFNVSDPKFCERSSKGQIYCPISFHCMYSMVSTLHMVISKFSLKAKN